MSEYIEIETAITDDPAVLAFSTNLRLAEEGVERYDSPAEMEVGSAVAQAMALVEGIKKLRIEGGDMLVTRDSKTPWHLIIAEVTAALKEFFL
jgi:hypothetical protein